MVANNYTIRNLYKNHYASNRLPTINQSSTINRPPSTIQSDPRSTNIKRQPPPTTHHPSRTNNQSPINPYLPPTTTHPPQANSARKKGFKKGVDADDSRRRRTESTFQIRKEKKEDQILKRRGVRE